MFGAREEDFRVFMGERGTTMKASNRAFSDVSDTSQALGMFSDHPMIKFEKTYFLIFLIFFTHFYTFLDGFGSILELKSRFLKLFSLKSTYLGAQMELWDHPQLSETIETL